MHAPSRQSLAAAFSDPAAFGVVQLLALQSLYGTEPLATSDDPDGWTPASIRDEIARDLQVELGPSNMGKLMAAIVVLQEPGRFYGNLPDFIDLANALNGDSYDPGTVDFVSALEAAWAFYEAYLVEHLCLAPYDGPDDGHAEPSAELRAYLGKVLDQEGILDPPDILRLAEHDPDRMGRVLGDFSDDPAMFEAIGQVEQEKTRAIEGELLARLRLLIEQLARLYRTDAADVMKSFGLRMDADGLLD